MKRIFPVVAGALAGAIGLPILMWACATVAHLVSPHLVGALRRPTFTDIETCFIFGVILGVCSAVLWSGTRTIWARIICALCAVGVGALPVHALRVNYYNPNVSTPLNPYLLSLSAYFFPLLLWVLALFFFAIPARHRKPLLS